VGKPYSKRVCSTSTKTDYQLSAVTCHLSHQIADCVVSASLTKKNKIKKYDLNFGIFFVFELFAAPYSPAFAEELKCNVLNQNDFIPIVYGRLRLTLGIEKK